MAKQRKVNAAAFQRQLEEAQIGRDSLFEIEANAESSVWVKIIIDQGEDNAEYLERVRRCTSEREVALEVLAHYSGASAEEQLATWEAAGLDVPLLLRIVNAETLAAQERSKNFRYRG